MKTSDMKHQTSVKKYLLLIVMMLMSIGMQALEPCSNDGPRFDPNQYRKMLEEHITCKAGLTPSEAQAFFPIFHEMKGKQRDMNRKIMEIKMSCRKAEKTDKEYANSIEEIKELNANIAKIEATYYKKLCKAVSAKKVFLAMQAEDFFHRDMLMKFNQRRGNGGHPQKK